MLPDERAQLRMDLARGFGCLDGPEKQAILLKFYEGLDQDEIAKALGVAIGSVSGILKRALAKLRPHMKGWSNTDRFRDGEES
jgi:RNA polymerase sigma factor (sigma-70 family)